jgi:hypothetical protein
MSGEGEDTVKVGKELPIFLMESMHLIGVFRVVSVNQDANTCNVLWPNGFIDENVPLEDMQGDVAYIPPEDRDKYIKKTTDL